MDISDHLLELRLLIEELCCDLCRSEHSREHGEKPEEVEIHREVALGEARGFADIFVTPKTQPPYFVEVKFGYADDDVFNSLTRKYGGAVAKQFAMAKRVVLVLDRAARDGFDEVVERCRESLGPNIALEAWDEAAFSRLVGKHFGVTIGQIVPDALRVARSAVDDAKGEYAFGTGPDGKYHHDPLKSQLLWHFGPWRLRQLRDAESFDIHDIFAPREYPNVAILLADLCSFSSYVRDTIDPEIIRHNLTAFYSRARYEILNNGGMLYQFVGDEVIGFFGIPNQPKGYIEAAYRTARFLAAVGRSVAEEWQKHIDRVQPKAGIHIGMSLGSVQSLPLRPFSRTHCGFIADSINIAARLMSEGTADEIVVTNSFYKQLSEASRSEFAPLEPVDARNVGKIRAWKTRVEL